MRTSRLRDFLSWIVAPLAPLIVSISALAAAPSVSDRDLGQLLLIGFKGHEINEGLGQAIRKFHPGGVLLFGRNVKTAFQVSELTYNAQQLSMAESKKPLLIAIDQEGGNVIRIKHAPTLPSSLALSATADATVAHMAGLATGRLLKTLGINMNLAPVVDVSDPKSDRFLGTRSFGNNPEHVAAMSTELARGLQSSGVLPVAKHFPGHGDTSGDSHFVAASSPLDREEVVERDLVPYKSLAKNLKSPWGIMLAHVNFPKIDPTLAPATFSIPIVQGLLRKELGNDVLVVTDDIEMAGASSEKNVGQRAVRAIEAGADMVMIAWSMKVQKEVLLALRKAVDSGRIKPHRIRQSLARIKSAKEAYVGSVSKMKKPESVGHLRAALQNPAFNDIGKRVLTSFVNRYNSERSAASEDDELSSLRPKKFALGEDPVLLLSARNDFVHSFDAYVSGVAKSDSPKTKFIRLKEDDRDSILRKLRASPESPIVAYASGPQAVRFISSFDDDLASRIYLVNVETNALLREPSRFRAVLNSYYRHPELGRAVAKILIENPNP